MKSDSDRHKMRSSDRQKMIFVAVLAFFISSFFSIVAFLNYATVKKIQCRIIDVQKIPGELETFSVYVSLDENNSTYSEVRVTLNCYCSKNNPCESRHRCLKSGIEYYREQIGQENSCDKHDRTTSKILSAPELFLSEEPWEINYGVGMALAINLFSFGFLIFEYRTNFQYM